MYVFFSTPLICALMIAVSDSKAIGSLVGSRRQTNTIPSKARTLHRSQRQLVNLSRTDFAFSGISDFAYMGEIAIPNFRKNKHSPLISTKPNTISRGSSNAPSEDDSSIVFFDNNTEQIRNVSTSRRTSSTTTTSTTVKPSARGPNACQLMCHRRITNEYNPRCGSDGITYYNPGKLDCAKRCGKEINRFTYASCGPGVQVI